MLKSNAIRLFWWNEVKMMHKKHENYGDLLGKYLVEKIFDEKGVKPLITMSIDSNETIKQSVLANMGLTFISLRAIRRELDAGLLKLINVEGLPYIGHWYIMHRTEKKLSPSTGIFKQFIKSCCCWF
jgi:DNA-binding transcriptional LysR family regulator